MKKLQRQRKQGVTVGMSGTLLHLVLCTSQLQALGRGLLFNELDTYLSGFADMQALLQQMQWPLVHVQQTETGN